MLKAYHMTWTYKHGEIGASSLTQIKHYRHNNKRKKSVKKCDRVPWHTISSRIVHLPSVEECRYKQIMVKANVGLLVRNRRNSCLMHNHSPSNAITARPVTFTIHHAIENGQAQYEVYKKMKNIESGGKIHADFSPPALLKQDYQKRNRQARLFANILPDSAMSKNLHE